MGSGEASKDGLHLISSSGYGEIFPLAVEMIVKHAHDPVLVQFKAVVNNACGSSVERAVLYGFRARGDAGPGSDYDMAVFLRDLADRGMRWIVWPTSALKF